MTTGDDASPPKREPIETGVTQEQQPGPVPDERALEKVNVGPALQPSAMASAFQEAGAFRHRAAEVFASRWADDVHGRLHRTEDELHATRRELDAQRDRATRLDERLAGLEREHGAQERLKVLGGAAIGFGLPLLFEGPTLKGAVGVGCILAGWLMAYGVPWGRRHAP